MQMTDCASEPKMKAIEVMCNASAAVSAVESGTAEAAMTALVATADKAPTPTPKRVLASVGLIRTAANATSVAKNAPPRSLIARSWFSRSRSIEKVKREYTDTSRVGSEMSPKLVS